MWIEKKMYCEHGFADCPYKTDQECNLFLPVPGSALCSLSPIIGDPHKKDKSGCDIAASLNDGVDE